MTISIDWDNTYTADTWLWSRFVELAVSRGHRVIVCSNRAFLTPELESFTESIDVFLAGDCPKREYLANLGIFPDIWIDDMPGTIESPVELP